MLKVIITDDHAIIRRGIRQILLEEFSFVHMEEITDGKELLNRVKAEHWDIVMIDSTSPGLMELLKQLVQEVPQLPVLLLSFRPEGSSVTKAIQQGAAGYFLKDAEPPEVIRAVRQVLTGKKYIPEKMAGRDPSFTGHLAHEILSDRELDVFKLLAAGKTVTQIGKLLDLESNTVSTYRTRLLNKMNLRTNADILRYAMEQGLI